MSSGGKKKNGTPFFSRADEEGTAFALETARVSSGWAGLAEIAVLSPKGEVKTLSLITISAASTKKKEQQYHRSPSLQENYRLVRVLQELASAQLEFLERNKKGKHLEDRLPFILQKFYSACFFRRQPLCAHQEVFQVIFSPSSKTRLYLAPTKMALI